MYSNLSNDRKFFLFLFFFLLLFFSSNREILVIKQILQNVLLFIQIFEGYSKVDQSIQCSNLTIFNSIFLFFSELYLVRSWKTLSILLLLLKTEKCPRTVFGYYITNDKHLRQNFRLRIFRYIFKIVAVKYKVNYAVK